MGTASGVFATSGVAAMPFRRACRSASGNGVKWIVYISLCFFGVKGSGAQERGARVSGTRGVAFEIGEGQWGADSGVWREVGRRD
jgi:hypothetical protein